MAAHARAQLAAAMVLLLVAAAPAEEAATQPASLAQEVHQSKMDLWRESIRAPEAVPAAAGLERLRQEVQSMEVASRKPVGPGPTSAPVSATSQPAEAKAGAERVAPKLTAEQLEQFRKLPPHGLASPAAVADSLFARGQLEAAAVFYELALRNTRDASDTAWLLLQLGNCWQRTDPMAAQGLYKRLMAEHPESVWSVAAQVQQRLLQWRQEAAPEAWLAESASPGSAETAPAAGGKAP